VRGRRSRRLCALQALSNRRTCGWAVDLAAQVRSIVWLVRVARSAGTAQDGASGACAGRTALGLPARDWTSASSAVFKGRPSRHTRGTPTALLAPRVLRRGGLVPGGKVRRQDRLTAHDTVQPKREVGAGGMLLQVDLHQVSTMWERTGSLAVDCLGPVLVAGTGAAVAAVVAHALSRKVGVCAAPQCGHYVALSRRVCSTLGVPEASASGPGRCQAERGCAPRQRGAHRPGRAPPIKQPVLPLRCLQL